MSNASKFKTMFGIDLEWFTRDDSHEFDLTWFRCWLGNPREGVESRCHRLFGPQATEFVLSLVPAEQEMPVFSPKLALQSSGRVKPLGRT